MLSPANFFEQSERERKKTYESFVDSLLFSSPHRRLPICLTRSCYCLRTIEKQNFSRDISFFTDLNHVSPNGRVLGNQRSIEQNCEGKQKHCALPKNEKEKSKHQHRKDVIHSMVHSCKRGVSTNKLQFLLTWLFSCIGSVRLTSNSRFQRGNLW